MRTLALPRSLVWGPVLCVLATAPSISGEYLAGGDGSGTDNPDLLNGTANCSNCNVGPAPREYDAPLFDIDWALALRGGYVLSSTTGGSFAGTAVPTVVLTQEGLRSSFALTATATLEQSQLYGFRVPSAQLSAAGEYELDAATRLTGAANLSLSQDSPNPPTTLSQPQILHGDAEVGVAHKVGDFEVGARVNAGRTMYGESTLAGGVVVDNSWENNTSVGGGLRVAYPITPTLTAFADGSAKYQYFDGPSPVVLAKLDGPTYIGRVGVAYDPSSILSAEASVGYGLRRFDAGFADVGAVLYDASVIFRPDETLTLNGGFSTEITPPSSSDIGLARVTYTATAAAAYAVNPWLGLRASADWYWADVAGTADYETGYHLKAGADYLVNDNTRLTADYTYTRVDAPPPAVSRDSHKFEVGVTFSK